MKTNKEIETLYLDYFNNYLTVDTFALNNNLTKEEANNIINEGRKINNT